MSATLDRTLTQAAARYNQGDFAAAEAIPMLRTVLAADGANLGALDASAAALLMAGEHGEAERVLKRMLAGGEDTPLVNIRLGIALASQRRPQEAIPHLERAAREAPDFAEAHYNLGNALMEQNALEEAARCFERAIALKPEYVKAHSDLGAVRQEQGGLAEAAACHERALALDPGLAQPQYNIAMLRLFRQEFEDALPLYEARLGCDRIRERFRNDVDTLERYSRLARWRGPGEAGAGEVAIWAEQGIGDQVLFSTLVPELIEAGVPFVYEVDHRLLAAYERAFPGARFVAKEDPPQDALQRARYVLAIGSLPGLFRRTGEDFARQPAKLLSALPERVAYYRQRLEALEPGLKVALSWRSTRKDWFVRKKSASLAQFTPLLKLAGAHFLDVQYGDTTAERNAVEAAAGVRLTRFDEVDYFKDLEEVLAILEACDLLITTSNATAHFAGALGQRTWLLYLADQAPFNYWAHDRNYRSLWYPSVEIVSAAQLTDWNSLIEHAARKLELKLAQSRAGPRARAAGTRPKGQGE